MIGLTVQTNGGQTPRNQHVTQTPRNCGRGGAGASVVAPQPQSRGVSSSGRFYLRLALHASAVGQVPPPPLSLRRRIGLAGRRGVRSVRQPAGAGSQGQLILLPDGRWVRSGGEPTGCCPGWPRCGKHAAGKPAAGDKPLAKEEQEAAALLQKYLSVQQIQRTPGQALRAKADLCAPPKKPAARRQGRRQAGQGRWRQGRRGGQLGQGAGVLQPGHHRRLEGDQEPSGEAAQDVGPQVYTYLLVLMAKGKAYVLPDEILALADASPQDLDEPQLAALGQLFAQAREKLGLPKTMLAHLEQGTRRYGGENPKKRLTAARLLAGAGMIDQALLYLPPMDEVRTAKDPVLLNLYAACLQTLAERTPGGGGVYQAWELTQMVLDTPKLADEPKAEAVRRMVALVPLMPEKTVAAWVKRRFREQPELGMLLLAEAAQRSRGVLPREGARAAADGPGRAAPARRGAAGRRGQERPAVGRRHRADDARLDQRGGLYPGQQRPPGRRGRRPGPRQRGGLVGPGGAGNSESWRRCATAGAATRSPACPRVGLLPFSPSDAWCQVLAPDVAWQARRLSGKLAAEVGDQAGGPLPPSQASSAATRRGQGTGRAVPRLLGGPVER